MLKSHTHLQFAPANATPKIAKEYVFANAHFRTSIKTSENQAGRGKPAYNNV